MKNKGRVEGVFILIFWVAKGQRTLIKLRLLLGQNSTVYSF